MEGRNMDNMRVRIEEAHKITVFEAFQRSEKENIFFSGERYVMGYHFGHHFIGDFLTEEKIRETSCEKPVMIIAQTGSGKSTLVMEKILRLMKETGKRLLILASRTALANQYKQEIAKREMPHLLEELTPVGLNRRTEFGRVEVWTYQHAYYELVKEGQDFREFGAVVFDECHYFVQDASFDVFTHEILCLAVKNLRHCRRFYLTATPDMVADKIIEEEWKNWENMFRIPLNLFALPVRSPQFLLYEFEADYSYINPIFFRETEEIIDIIRASKEKFFICVDSKEVGEMVQNKLGTEVAEYIDAELKNGEKAEIVRNIISSEKFEKRVLIVTSFLDVGVNLQDEDLHNVVIFSASRTHFVQAIGRKRRKKDENVNLYIKILSSKRLKKLQGRIMAELKEIGMRINQEYDRRFSITQIQFPFFIEKRNGEIQMKYNGFTLSNLKFRYGELERMLDSSTRYESEEEGVAREYLRWIGIEERYPKCRWLGAKPDYRYKKLTDFLEKNCEIELDKEGFQNFRKDLLDLNNEVCVSNEKWRDDRLPHVEKINSFLDKCGMEYQMLSSQNPLSYKLERR